MTSLLIMFTGLLPLIPVTLWVLTRRRRVKVELARKVVFGLSTVNIIMALLLVGMGAMWFVAPEVVAAAGLVQTTSTDPYAALAAAAAVGIGSIGAAYAVSATGAAAIGAIAEKPDVFGKALIFVGLAEGVAIYGLIIAFMILNR